MAGTKLVRTTDFEVVHDFATGQLYAIELHATPEYRATPEIVLHDHPNERWGYVIDGSVGGDQPYPAFRLWRAP